MISFLRGWCEVYRLYLFRYRDLRAPWDCGLLAGGTLGVIVPMRVIAPLFLGLKFMSAWWECTAAVLRGVWIRFLVMMHFLWLVKPRQAAAVG
jgi:hypothetical protein